MNTSVLYRRYIILGKIINLCIYIFLGFGWPGVVFVFVFVVGLGIWRESVGDFFFSGKYSCLLASNLGFALRLKLGVEAEVTSVGDGTCSTRFFAAPLATCLARTPNPRACRVSLWQWAPGETVTTKSILASPPIWINTNTKVCYYGNTESILQHVSEPRVSIRDVTPSFSQSPQHIPQRRETPVKKLLFYLF